MKKLAPILFVLFIAISGCSVFENENEIPPKIDVNPSASVLGEEITVSISREEGFYMLECTSSRITFSIEKQYDNEWERVQWYSVACPINNWRRTFFENSTTLNILMNEIGTFRIAAEYSNQIDSERLSFKSEPFLVLANN